MTATLTLEHQRQWCAEAGANLAETGRDHGVQWRIGPAPAAHSGLGTYADGKPVMTSPQTHCKVCELEIQPGQTVVQTTAKELWGWRCVKCFDWNTVTILEGTTSSRRQTGQPGYNRREISAKQAAKELLKVVPSAPSSFRIEACETLTHGRKLDKDEVALLAAVKVVAGVTRVAPTKPAPTPRKVTAPKVAPKTEPSEAFKAADERWKQTVPAFVTETQAPTAQKPAIPSSGLPQWAEEWLAGLVFETKRDYARQFLAHLLCDAPAPECPGTEWAEKARKRARRLTEIAA